MPRVAQDDNVSIIRLLRVFLGVAVEDGEDAIGSSSSSSSSSSAAAREQAGCALWDMSADAGHASAMCAAGLAAVSCKVLSDCAGAKARASAFSLAAAGTERTDEPARDAGGEESIRSKEAEPSATAVAGEGAADTVKATGQPLVSLGSEVVERLREVACGLLANVCSHRGLR